MKQYVSLVFIVLASLSSYCIAEYTNNLHLSILGIDDIPNSYKLLFGISKITSALVPVVISFFIVITTSIMLNDVFDKHVSPKMIIQIVGFSYIPMVLYYYFFWINLIQYGSINSIKIVDDFTNMEFIFGMHLSDFSLINLLCWLYMYIFIAYNLIKRKIDIMPAIISTFLPSAIFLFAYCLMMTL